MMMLRVDSPSSSLKKTSTSTRNEVFIDTRQAPDAGPQAFEQRGDFVFGWCPKYQSWPRFTEMVGRIGL